MKYEKILLSGVLTAVLSVSSVLPALASPTGSSEAVQYGTESALEKEMPEMAEDSESSETNEFVSQYILVYDGLSVRDYNRIEVLDSSVVTTEMTYDGIKITSEAPGTTEIRILNDRDQVDILRVTVKEDGSLGVDYTILWTGWSGMDDKYRVNGELANGWTKDMGHWYYFVDGVAKTGWFQDMEDDGNWYYLKETKPGRGVMQTGWITDSTGWKHYYLDSNGRMRHSQWIYSAEKTFYGPAGYYYLTDDGAVQMNGWTESVTPGIYWYVRPTDGWFNIDDPACWSTAKLW